MSNVLAALFGGLGAGASSYGTQRIREQDQERLAAQRMAELQQQEDSRVAVAREQAALRAQQLKEDGEQAAIIAKAAGIPLPEGARVNSQGVGILGQIAANRRFSEGQQGAMDRLEKTLGGRMDQIVAQGDINKAIAAMGNDTRRTIAAMMEAGRNKRDNGQQEQQSAWVQRRVTDLLKPDDFGRTASIEEATAQARREAGVLFGGEATPGPTRAPQSTGANLMRGLGVPTLSEQDQQRAASDPAFRQWLISKGHKL